MGGGSSDSGTSSGDNTVHFAEYWEAAHQSILNHDGADTVSSSVVDAFNATIGDSPFGGAKDIAGRIDDSFFTSGYDITSFPSLWDMFGKFMAGVDVHVLWAQTFNGISTSPEINAAVTAQAAYLEDDMETNVYPRFEAGMRNINAVQSSAFMNGRAILEDSRVKAINKFASEIRLRALDSSIDFTKSHMKWQESVVMTFAQMFKLYYAIELDVEAQKMDFEAKDELWDINLYEYLRGVMGMVSGSPATVRANDASTGGGSSTMSALGGALGGASVGAAVGGVPGAVVGGVLGLATSFF